MSGLADITDGMAMPTVGKQAGGKNHHTLMQYGLRPDIRTAMTGMFIRKAAGGSLLMQARDVLTAGGHDVMFGEARGHAAESGRIYLA
jgi:hypothetical protein